MGQLALTAQAAAQMFTPGTQLLSPQPVADGNFGNQVSLSGQLLAVGSTAGNTPGAAGSGSVHIYRRSGSGWLPDGEPVPGGLLPGDQFCSVSIDGDRLLAGAGQKSARIGAAYIFERNPVSGTWEEKAALSPAGATSSCGNAHGCHLFGTSVALRGDVAVVSANVESMSAGAIYVFERSPAGVWQRTRLVANDATAWFQFGNHVAFDGQTIAVGASHDSSGVAGGAAYVFARVGGAWQQRAKLLAPDAALSDVFGASVDIHGDSIIVGAYGDDIDGRANQGSAHVFVRGHDDVWRHQAKLVQPALGSAPAADDQFGYAVRIRGDLALISKFPGEHSLPSGAANGEVFLFRRSGETWQGVAHAVPADGSNGDAFGHSLALQESRAAVGAYAESEPPGSVRSGSAYLFGIVPDDRIFADGFDGQFVP